MVDGANTVGDTALDIRSISRRRRRGLVAIAAHFFRVILGLLTCTSVMDAMDVPETLRGDLQAHDPSSIVKCGGRYYLFCTGPGIRSKSSSDLIQWTAGPAVFSRVPAWTTNVVPGFDGRLWAPDVIAVRGSYLLYYSVSTWGKQTSAIGLATNATLDPSRPNYAWQDQGIVIQSHEGEAFNAIDPGVWLDQNGDLWMVFGSFWTGIKLVQLDPATGKRIRPDSPIHGLAYHPAIEAAALCERGGYYYLFVNWDKCCAGTNSTYQIRVGRSVEVTGPFLDQDGKDLLFDGGTRFMASSGRRIGPGQAAVYREQGNDWLSYHYYDALAGGAPRLGLTRLTWTAEGWPRVE